MIAKKLTNIAYSVLLGLMLPFSAQFATAQDILPSSNLYWVGHIPETFEPISPWNEGVNWSPTISEPVGGTESPDAGTMTHFGATRPGASLEYSTTVSFIAGTPEHAYGIEFTQNDSFLFEQSAIGSTLQLGLGGIANKGTGSQVFDIDVSFATNSVISNESDGAISFLRDVSSTGPANTPSVEISAGSLTFAGLDASNLGITQTGGNLNFASLDASNLGIAHTGGNLTFGEAVTIGTGDSLSVAGSGEINFNGGLAFDSGGRFTWDLNSTAEINASEIDFGGNFVTELDLTGYNSLEDLEGLQLDIFNSVADIEALPANFSFTFINNNGIDGIDSDLFTWQITNNGNTLTLVSLAAVPEPSTIVLLGVAGAIGGVVARRRKKMATNDQAEEAVVA